MSRCLLLEVFLLALTASTIAGRQIKQYNGIIDFENSQSNPSFEVAVGGGPSAYVKRSLVVASPTGQAYTVVQVNEGVVNLSGISIAVSQKSIVVYKNNKDNSKVEWGVSLQAKASHPQVFALGSAAVNPANGDLVVIGTYTGTLAIGELELTSAGSLDTFVAYISKEDGSVVWTQSMGNSSSPEAAFDVIFDSTAEFLYVAGTQDAGIFVASYGVSNGAKGWVSNAPSSKPRVSSIKVAEVEGDIFIAAGLSGSVTVALRSNIAVPENSAAAVVYKMTSAGSIDMSSSSPLLLLSTSIESDPTLLVTGLQRMGDTVVLSATYSGSLTVNGSPLSNAVDETYSNGLVMAFDTASLTPLWKVPLTGPSSQTVNALTVVPDGASLFFGGSTTAGSLLQIDSMSISGETSYDSYIAQLGADGTLKWIRRFHAGSRESVTSLAYLNFPSRLMFTGLFDEGQECIRLLIGREDQCSEGKRAFYVASMPVDPGNTSLARQSEAGASTSSELSAGAIAGIVVGSVAAAAILAAIGTIMYKKKHSTVPSDFASLSRGSPVTAVDTMMTTNPVANPFYR